MRAEHDRGAGYTLIELVAALTVASILAGFAFPRATGLVDTLRVRGAGTELATLLADARRSAIVRGTRTAVTLDTASAIAVARLGDDTLRVRRLRDSFGVTLSATRDSIAFAPSGLGYGAANTTIIVRRNRVADTIIVSRLGRVRRTVP